MSSEDLLAEAERMLDEAEAGRFADDGRAVAAVAVAADAINEELKKPDRDRRRLREVIEKLQKAGREVATSTGAQSFSITVGFPVGISVSFEWLKSD
jgi:hypothetical protein